MAAGIVLLFYASLNDFIFLEWGPVYSKDAKCNQGGSLLKKAE